MLNGVMIMKKKKSTYELLKEMRGQWVINPRTRVQDNDLKNKKKRRQDEKKMVKSED
jgi:hypothetical protein